MCCIIYTTTMVKTHKSRSSFCKASLVILVFAFVIVVCVTTIVTTHHARTVHCTPNFHDHRCKIQALVMAEVPNSLALSGSSLVVLSVLAFALEQPILSSLS